MENLAGTRWRTAAHPDHETSLSHTAEESTNIQGDINNDGQVNITDLTTLRLYLAGYNITINHANANLNNDGYVNAEDAELLRQLLAGHPVTFD